VLRGRHSSSHSGFRSPPCQPLHPGGLGSCPFWKISGSDLIGFGHIVNNFRCGSRTDSTVGPAIGPLSGVKRTKSGEKRTCRLDCRLSGAERTLFVRGCQDRS
jgi:hypothetical protein